MVLFTIVYRVVFFALCFTISSLVYAGPPDSGSVEKSIGNGLYISNFTANYSGSTLTITANINNDSFTRSSGTLRLEYWAAPSPPSRGQPFVGYRLGISSNISPLAPRTSYTSLVRIISPYVPPPDGTYTMVLLLNEFDSINCPAADFFCLSDSVNADQPRTWAGGLPQAPETTTATLENPSSGSFQSGIGLISGWSCEGPVAVSIDGAQISAPYGSPRGDTSSLCGGAINNGFGLLVNYNNFGAGTHTAQLYVNGAPRGSATTFTVTVPSGEFMRGLSQSVSIPNFPSPGRTTVLIWQESQQNFAIQSVFP